MPDMIQSLHECLKVSFPPVTLQLMQEAVREEPNFAAIADIVGMDPVLTAAVLNLANSPFYALSQKVVDIPRAVVVLGAQELLKLGLAVSFHQSSAKDQRETEYANWRLIVWAAIAAELIAEKIDHENAGRAYICTLLKDLSLLLAVCAKPPLVKGSPKNLLIPERPGQGIPGDEQSRLGHEALTVRLLEQWNLPDDLGDAILYHHDLDNLDKYSPFVQSVILATRWSEVELNSVHTPYPLLQFEVQLRTHLGLDENGMADLRDRQVERFKSMLATLGIDESTPDARYYQHSIQEMQQAYFLSMDVMNVRGGVEAAAQAICRQVRFNLGITEWEIALLSPDKSSWVHFVCSTGEACPSTVELDKIDTVPWEIREKGYDLAASGRKIGEIRVGKGLSQCKRESLGLLVRFISQAYEYYTIRSFTQDMRADTLSSLPIGVARVDQKGRVLDCNEKWAEHLGLEEDTKGQALLPMLNSRFGIASDRGWRDFFTGSRRSISKFYCELKGGPSACSYLSAHKLNRSEREEFLFLVEDITEITELEKQAIRQRDFLEAVVTSMHDIVLTTNSEGMITYCSPNAYKDDEDHLSGRNLFEIAKPAGSFTGTWTATSLPLFEQPVEVIMRLHEARFASLELVFSHLQHPGSKEDTYLIVARDLTAIRRLEERLKLQAIYDGLTQLLNHSQFQILLDREVTRAHRTERSLGLVFCDLDGFKKVNDTKGHQSGDDILRAVGRILKRYTRRGMDFPCRYGGDEFTVIVTEVSKAQLEALSDRLIREIGQTTKDDVGVSVGLAMLRKEESTAAFLRRADEASYAAKRLGGNRLCWAEE